MTDLVRQVGRLLPELGLSEIAVSVGEVRVRLTRILAGPPAPCAMSPGAATASATAEPYVREGDAVKEGQILCIMSPN